MKLLRPRNCLQNTQLKNATISQLKFPTFDLVGFPSGLNGAFAASVELAVVATCRRENYEKAEVIYILNQSKEYSDGSMCCYQTQHFLTLELLAELADTTALRGFAANVT